MGTYGNRTIMGIDNKIIKIDDVEGAVYEIDNWKPQQVTTVKNHFTEKFKELKEAYEGLVEDFNWNKIIYDSEMLATPVMGQEYHLYQRMENAKHGNPGSRFMSLIAPHEWGSMDDLSFIGTFKQDSRQKWTHIKLADKYEEINETKK
jgi:hypothetical protein